MMNNTSAELREWAARCEDAAASAQDDKQRSSLLRKCEALRALADSEDWLAGQWIETASANGPVSRGAHGQRSAE